MDQALPPLFRVGSKVIRRIIAWRRERLGTGLCMRLPKSGLLSRVAKLSWNHMWNSEVKMASCMNESIHKADTFVVIASQHALILCTDNVNGKMKHICG